MIIAIIRAVIRWRVAVWLLVAAAIAASAYAIRAASLDAIPDISDPQVVVYVKWPRSHGADRQREGFGLRLVDHGPWRRPGVVAGAVAIPHPLARRLGPSTAARGVLGVVEGRGGGGRRQQTHQHERGRPDGHQ